MRVLYASVSSIVIWRPVTGSVVEPCKRVGSNYSSDLYLKK